MIALGTQTACQMRAPVRIDAARLALRCLHAELVLYPKPGLVSLVDNGSHTDMNAMSFVRSLAALRHYFDQAYGAGRDEQSFAHLQGLALAAEARMLRATGGVNTHRGAIFAIGLLCAALGACHARGQHPSAGGLRAALLAHWGQALRAHAAVLQGDSHGLRAAREHAVGGAREEGALGLPSVFEVALPVLRARLPDGAHTAQVDTLFTLMSHISDTNLYHRGGAGGAVWVREQARAFLAAGGTRAGNWMARALAMHRDCVARKLSPGGAADLLAATLFVHAATQ